MIIETTIAFESLNLNPALLEQIQSAGFQNISPIQNMTLEPVLEGKDIFAQAETGSGKTCAFVFPIIEQILRDEKHGKIEAHESRYVVLSPTRELAQQTYNVFQQFGSKLGIESCSIIGGESIDRQKEKIDKGIHVLVATPGRMVDLIKQKVIGLDHCQAVVFDEADRLFDMGFKKDIEFILSKMPKERQLIMLSATSNQDVLRTAYKFNSHPEELCLNVDSLLVDHIDHKLAMVSGDEKFPLLVSTLRKKEDAYAIVFCNTQFQTHAVAEWLIKMGFKAKPISGRLPQNKRTKLMEDFRSKKVTILVCTDVAARGLDIKNVNLVINYDLPQDPANYVHRIGRTGRAGEEGEAISFCAHEDCEFLDPIYDLIEAKIEKMDLDEKDFATDICKKPYIDRKTLRVNETTQNNNKTKRDNNKGPKSKTKGPENKAPRPEKGAAPERSERPKRSENKDRPRIDRRFIELEAYKLADIKQKAMSHLRITDDGLLGSEVLSESKKKYILFGPRLTKYKFFIIPIYKRLLLPFLIDTVKKANLDLYVKVSYRENSLLVSFSGKDEKLLKDNRFELLNAFEHLIKTYLQSRIVLSRNLKIQVKCYAKRPETKSKDVDEKALIELAKKAKKEALETQNTVSMKPLNPAERRIIHQYFEKDQKVKTSSKGDGRLKNVVIELS